ncbi:MAG: hypothetical protein ACM3UZ_01715 [Acidobacteriota bacterium]
MVSEIKEIIDIVYGVFSNEINTSDKECYLELLNLTASIWEEHHSELIHELSLIAPDSGLDFQLFWYDCLGFHDAEMPKMFFKSGKPMHVLYGCIPSEIWRAAELCSGFHDANINYVSYNKDSLSLYLDQRCWGIQTNQDYQVKLSFRDVKGILGKKNDGMESMFEPDDIIGCHVLSLQEIPSIDYIYKNINIPVQYYSHKNRLFYIWLGGQDLAELDHIIVICRGWDYEHKE